MQKVIQKHTPKPLHININGFAKNSLTINHGLNLAILPKSASQAELRPKALISSINQRSTGNLNNCKAKPKKVSIKKHCKKYKNGKFN
jgi:hypothetical protein